MLQSQNPSGRGRRGFGVKRVTGIEPVSQPCLSARGETKEGRENLF